MTKKEYASTLIEALPYIKKFSGKTIVIKYGGSAQSDTELNKLSPKERIVKLNLFINNEYGYIFKLHSCWFDSSFWILFANSNIANFISKKNFFYFQFCMN